MDTFLLKKMFKKISEKHPRPQALKKRMVQKWSFADTPMPFRPRRQIAVELVQTLISILKVDAKLSEELMQLHRTLLQAVDVDEPHLYRERWSPNYISLKVPNVECPNCLDVDDVDVVTCPVGPPGQWICANCSKYYDRSVMEQRLVAMLVTLIQVGSGYETDSCPMLEERPAPMVRRN